MEIAQEKLDLIGKIIKNDRKYLNNEDLFEDFFNETCKRSAAIIDSIDTEATLEAYLRRIVTTSIINVLKDSGRLRRAGGTYQPAKEIPVEKVPEFPDGIINYANITVPQNPEEIVIQKEILDFVADTIVKIDKENPEKDYLQIYTLRYDKGMTQAEISEELGISQGEVSKRLFKLMEKVRSIIE